MTSAIDDAELPALFLPLVGYKLVVLAVSGGPDSMGLMHLLARFLAQQSQRPQPSWPTPDVLVVTVDHRLRLESAREASWVGEEARRLGFTHEVCVWAEPHPASGVQAAARAARYRLLADVAKRQTPAAIVTAHTEDDQAETLLMRLARGSGLDGLSAMPVRRPLAEGVDLVRPLLAVAKRRLIATLEAAGVAFLSDPSNERAEFERVRLRRALDGLAEVGLTTDKLALSARRLARARDAIEEASRTFCRSEVDYHDGIYGGVRRDRFDALARELQVRVMAHLLAAFGGSSPRARLSEVEDAVEVLSGGGKTSFTLGGAIVSVGERMMRVYREPGRTALPALELASGGCSIWDGRFRVCRVGATDFGGWAGRERMVRVQAFDPEAYATWAGSASDEQKRQVRALPARALTTLPSFWTEDGLMAVPSLGIGEAGHLVTAEFVGADLATRGRREP